MKLKDLISVIESDAFLEYHKWERVGIGYLRIKLSLLQLIYLKEQLRK